MDSYNGRDRNESQEKQPSYNGGYRNNSQQQTSRYGGIYPPLVWSKEQPPPTQTGKIEYAYAYTFKKGVKHMDRASAYPRLFAYGRARPNDNQMHDRTLARFQTTVTKMREHFRKYTGDDHQELGMHKKESWNKWVDEYGKWQLSELTRRQADLNTNWARQKWSTELLKVSKGNPDPDCYNDYLKHWGEYTTLLAAFLYSDEIDPPPELDTPKLTTPPNAKYDLSRKWVEYWAKCAKGYSSLRGFFGWLGDTVPCPFWYTEGTGRKHYSYYWWGLGSKD